MEYQSCFDIIGPIMVGPSSSHTAGVVSIGKFVYELLGGSPQRADITFYDSFSETYQGHGTDKALLGGLLGMNTDDTRIRYAVELTKRYGLHYEFKFEDRCPYYDHPNTTVIRARRAGHFVKVGGVSLGGGLSKIFMIDDEIVDIRLSTSDDFSEIAAKFRSNPFHEAILEGV
ncbi:serine dehydratase beta chain [Neobacillus sp. SAB-20_R2A]|uniref:serine dehydratase beta chain n=1 Tax=Neobacillus sp. SAB-20_R2A TaxID=3120519 RepID=UPI003C6DC6AA